MAYFLWIQAARLLPSHRLTGIPASLGAALRTRFTSRSCTAVKRDGRPVRSPSANPPNPFSSKRRTQYSTVRGASPNIRPLPDKSFPVRPATLHAADGRTATLRSAEFPVVVQLPSTQRWLWLEASCSQLTTSRILCAITYVAMFKSGHAATAAFFLMPERAQLSQRVLITLGVDD